MALVDLANLSELLAELPDVTDDPDAITLPPKNVDDPDVVVEFDNVKFHYPTQPDTKGLKGLSFKMKRGTVTAVVGPTGGKIVLDCIVSYWCCLFVCMCACCICKKLTNSLLFYFD